MKRKITKQNKKEPYFTFYAKKITPLLTPEHQLVGKFSGFGFQIEAMCDG